jgi:hypothetical protein
MKAPGSVEEYTVLLKGEQEVTRYDVRHLKRKFPALVVVLVLLLFAVPALTALAAPGAGGAAVAALFAVAGMGVCVLAYASQPEAHGAVILTNHRLIYVEVASSWAAKRRTVNSIELPFIQGIRALTQNAQRRFLGLRIGQDKKTYFLQVETRAWTPLVIGAVTSRPGHHTFEPAAGALQSVQELGARVRQLQAEGRTARAGAA